MNLGLDTKRILITGGSRGIGKSIALAFARAGARVITCCREENEVAHTLTRELKELGDVNRVVRADVRVPEDVALLVETARRAFHGLDVVVNNAGIDGHSPIGDLSTSEWARVVDTNLTATYLITKAALPLLSEGGSVINLGASVALRGRPASAHYTASKAGVIGLTRSLCKELGPRGIRVNVVAPGVIETEPGAGLAAELRERIRGMTALGRLGTPDDVAGAVLFLASDASRYITGATLYVDGGM